MPVVVAVVAIADPVVRNVAITACYRDLALAVAEIVGRIDVNWLAFGAWASGSAGRVIRGDGLPLGLDLGTSLAVAEGNRAIIGDIAPRFVRWLDEVTLAGAPTRMALEVALADPKAQNRLRLPRLDTIDLPTQRDAEPSAWTQRVVH